MDQGGYVRLKKLAAEQPPTGDEVKQHTASIWPLHGVLARSGTLVTIWVCSFLSTHLCIACFASKMI